MERVLHQSWQWVRAWVPPGLTAIALVITMIGLWALMMDPNRSLFPRESASSKPAPVERAATEQPLGQTTTGQPQSLGSGTQTSSTTVASATTQECEALQSEIHKVSVRLRSTAKSKQSARLRSRLRELKQLHADECTPAT